VTRCRNCGILDHKTQHCPRYGPWFPEPGKERTDYAELAELITELVARDVLAEHAVDHDESLAGRERDELPKLKANASLETLARQYKCKRCAAEPGQPCIQRGGTASERSHRPRFELVEYGLGAD